MKKRKLSELAWNVTEAEYRAHEYVSYSGLSEFDRDGPKVIIAEKKILDTPSLRFGSLVDTLLTEPEMIESKFYFTTASVPSDNILQILNIIKENHKDDSMTLNNITESEITAAALTTNYGQTWKKETVINKVITEGSAYYYDMAKATGKIMLSEYDKKDAINCVEELKTNPFTAKYIIPDVFGSNDIFFQLKFINDEMKVRIMMDICDVNHMNKTIQPLDLKTTGKDENEFPNSAEKYRYNIQGGLYSEVLRRALIGTEYEDYTILPFKFIVINRKTLSPIVWVYSNGFDIKIKLYNYAKLLEDYYWHIANKLFKYRREVYDKGGELMLEDKV